jgi:hypothetical protein
MAYPNLPISVNSKVNRMDGTEVVRASNGMAKPRRMYPSDKWEFDILHELSSAQWTTLNNHYLGAEGTTSFQFTWPTTGTAYTVVYAGPPNPVEQPGGWFKVYVKLAQV